MYLFKTTCISLSASHYLKLKIKDFNLYEKRSLFLNLMNQLNDKTKKGKSMVNLIFGLSWANILSAMTN